MTTTPLPNPFGAAPTVGTDLPDAADRRPVGSDGPRESVPLERRTVVFRAPEARDSDG